MYNRALSVATNSEMEAIRPDYPVPDAEHGTNDKPEVTHQVCGLETLQEETSAPPTSLINRLPTEILLRIFEFAEYLWRTNYTKKERADSPAFWDRSIQRRMALGYPEVLSHVCSLWRDIALSSPQLWSRLELYALSRSSQMYLNHCLAFLPRAQNHELELVVRFRHCDTEPLIDCAAMKDFCTSISPRLGSFSVDNLALEDTVSASSIIRASLPHTAPGTLTKLHIKDHIPRMILGQDNNIDGLVGWELPTAESCGISQHLLDSIVLPIRDLRLCSQFFPWTSPAYHGLVELHLQCTRPKRGHRPFIHISRLREILLACPELRIFYININITMQNTCPAPAVVPLNELEQLSLRGMSRSLYKVILPLLAPGQKPLQLTLETQRGDTFSLYCPAVLSFLQRTNVTSLYVLNRSSFDQYLTVDELVSKSPKNLVTLGLERFKISQVNLSRIDCLAERPPIQLSCLCLRTCTIDPAALWELAEILPAQVLKIHDPYFEGEPDEVKLARQQIYMMFPTIKWVRSSRDMELWHAWEVEYINYVKKEF